jgi:uncharacterized protein (TIGR00290 family)
LGDHPPVLLAFSGGKDSSLALLRLREERIPVLSLLVTITEKYDRVTMHGVRRELLALQASALGIPVDFVIIPENSSNEAYERRMAERLLFWKEKGVSAVAFGDIFLEDIKNYRIEQLSRIGMKALFPIFGEDSFLLARGFVQRGFEAVVVSSNARLLPPGSAGKRYDQHFLDHLPAEVDPCGERGEFHTFVYAGPLFRKPVPFRMGERVIRRYQHPGGVGDPTPYEFVDLLPEDPLG